MSKKNNEKNWYDVPPVELVDKLKNDQLLHKDVVRDLLELYKRDKNLTNGIINQIDMYAKPLLMHQCIERISINASDFGYMVTYVSDIATDDSITMELCISKSKTISSIGK